MRLNSVFVVVVATLLWGRGLSSSAQETAAPFRVCAVAGTPEHPWVGVVWTNDDAAFLMKPGDAVRGYTLKSVDVASGQAAFSTADREVVLMVAADAKFAERYRGELPEPGESHPAAANIEDFLNSYTSVVLADGTRLERPAGGWPREPVTYEDFVKQYEHLAKKGVDPVDEQLAARMKELEEESVRASQETLTPEEMERRRLDALRQMAEAAGMPPPTPEDLRPVTREEFLRRHDMGAGSLDATGSLPGLKAHPQP